MGYAKAGMRGIHALLVCLVSLWAPTAYSEELRGKIVAVLDGDSLVLQTESGRRRNIRLAWIDAPEKGQPFSNASRDHLKTLALGTEAQADCYKRQRNRQVCFVEVRGQDLGLEQINGGMAWWYQRYANEQPLLLQMSYEAAAKNAAAQRKGIWQEDDPVPPWDWKKANR